MTDRKILLIDDDPQACQMLMTYLVQKNYQVVSMNSGKEALDLAARESFDLVLIDLSLPDFNGIDLLQEMQARNQEAIYMIISGYASFENALLALKKGASDFISKPIQLADMNLRLEKALEKRALQKQVRNSDSFYQTIINSMRDAIAIINTNDCTIAGVNQAFLENYGCTEEQVLGRTCYEVTHRSDSKCGSPAHCCPIDLGFDSQEQVVVEHIHCDNLGKGMHVEVTVSPIRDETGKVVQVVHATRDISARKVIERQIKEQQEALACKHEQLNVLFRQVEMAKQEWETTMDCMGAAVILTDEAGGIKRCNLTFVKLINKSYTEIAGKHWEDVLHWIGLEPSGSVEAGTEVQHEPSRRWYFLQSFPLHDAAGKGLPGRVLTIHDTTELKAMAEELACKNLQIETNRAKLQAALNQLSSLIRQVAEEKDLGVQFIHPELPRCWEMQGCGQTQCPCYGREPMRCWQVAGTYCCKTIQGVFAKKISNCMQCRVYQTATSDPIYQIGEQFNNMMHILLVKNQELEKTLAELKATQSQMLQQEKMASIGQLAAGVAHEINNPLGFITSNLNTLARYRERLMEYIAAQNEVLESLAAADRLRDVHRRLKIDYISEDSLDLIKESRDGAERVTEIVRNLKGFSRVDQAELVLADLNECLESTLKIIWNELKYKTTVIKNYGGLPRTRCYPHQLNQVFMNLLVNAGQAIAEKGEITIRTWHDNGVICIAISDNGCGIPPDKLTKIFEPFYTTKPVGKGTGLGLSIVYDIITKHHGEIQVESELGRGTTFTVKVPVVEQAASA